MIFNVLSKNTKKWMRNMIELCKRIATILRRIRPVIICCLATSFLIILGSVFENAWLSFEFWLIPSFLAFCWFLVLYSFSEIFSFVPELSTKKSAWFKRLSNSIHTMWYRSLGVVSVCVFIALIILSYQLLRQWYLR